MKDKILYVALIISGILNIVLGFTLGYYFYQVRMCPPKPFFGQRFSRKEIQDRWGEMRKSPENEYLAEIKATRDSIFEERQKLIKLLCEPSPDSLELELAFSKMMELRDRLERKTFNGIRRGLLRMPAERRMKILDKIKKRNPKTF